MRAREPDVQCWADRDGVRIAYEVYGEGRRTVVLLPTWVVPHARWWKGSVPVLARRARVGVVEGRGNRMGNPAAGQEDSVYELRPLTLRRPVHQLQVRSWRRRSARARWSGSRDGHVDAGDLARSCLRDVDGRGRRPVEVTDLDAGGA